MFHGKMERGLLAGLDKWLAVKQHMANTKPLHWFGFGSLLMHLHSNNHSHLKPQNKDLIQSFPVRGSKIQVITEPSQTSFLSPLPRNTLKSLSCHGK